NDILRGGAGDDNDQRLVAGFKYGGLYGGAGNDILDGGDGNDYLDPGTGVDSVIGGLGNDILNLDLSTLTTGLAVNYTNTTSGTVTGGTTFREIEQVILKTGSGNDVVNLSATVGDGSSSNYGSNVSLGAGNDSVIGGTGTDAFYGEAGNDTLEGGADRDRLEGGDGNDILRGGAGDDNDQRLVAGFKYGGLYGGAGNDTLDGGDGNDALNGDADNDWLVGGAGNDILTGGNGADKFVYDTNRIFASADIGSDRITDFLIGTDKIVLDKTTFTALTSASGSALTSSEFAIINATTNSEIVAGSSSAKIIFNQANGDLFYNQNGTTTGLGTGSLFATLSGVTSLSTTDFVVQA
ncbi:calcium-binding protein, partial [Nostoc sp.]|uniref:calcium-binding protein n=1 Tax=Nostoc sp. TaxID=1180 RepID=UPI002FFAC074